MFKIFLKVLDMIVFKLSSSSCEFILGVEKLP